MSTADPYYFIDENGDIQVPEYDDKDASPVKDVTPEQETAYAKVEIVKNLIQFLSLALMCGTFLAALWILRTT